MASRPAKSSSTKSKPKVRACAECRRLKLRCDRVFPCQACVRRGCGALCPDHCFTDEATPSSLKASSLRSKEELRKLQERLTLIEAALATVQPHHPLLHTSSSPSENGSSSVVDNTSGSATPSTPVLVMTASTSNIPMPITPPDTKPILPIDCKPIIHQTRHPPHQHQHHSPSHFQAHLRGLPAAQPSPHLNHTSHEPPPQQPQRHSHPLPPQQPHDAVNNVQPAVDQAVEIFGALSIGDDGQPVFHGATSLAENFVQHDLPISVNRRHNLTFDAPSLPPNIQILSALFPFAPKSMAESTHINDLLAYVPPGPMAFQIAETYWYHLSIGCSPVSHHQYARYIHHFIFPDGKSLRPNFDRKKSHCLGMFYMVMALGTLTDVRFPILSADAERYHQLARACLSIHPICDHPTIPGLGALLCMSWYQRSTPTRTTAGYRWVFNGIILKIANALGIFRDSRRWLTSEDEIEQREVLAWELLCQEIWTSFTAGRPCSLDLTLIDCAKPKQSASIHADMGGFIRGFTQWKHRFYPLINDVLLLGQRPGPVKYSEILKLEKELRFCSMPEELESCVISPYQDTLSGRDLTKHIQGMTALVIRESACLMLHRRFLVLAMQYPGDPRESPFWYSAFQASFGASWVIKAHLMLYRRHPELVSRVPSYWSMAFSSACVLGAVAGRYGNQEFARATLAPFQAICALFAETAEMSIQPPNALEVLERLWRRVRETIEHTGHTSLPTFDDLTLLGAQPALADPSSSVGDNGSPPILKVSHHLHHDSSLDHSNPYPQSNSSSNRSSSTPKGTSSTLHQPYPGMSSQQQQPPPPVIPRQTPSPPTMAAIEQLWYAPELSLLPDVEKFGANGPHGQPMYTPVDQTYQPYGSSSTAGSSPEAVSSTPFGEGYGVSLNPGGLDGSTGSGGGHGSGGVPSPSGSGTEVGQWDLFLDRVGVWDPTTGVSSTLGVGVMNVR